MNKLIADKVGKALLNFEESAKTAKKLCPCKKLTYEQSNKPDYENPLVQHCYMLRYFPAYLV